MEHLLGMPPEASKHAAQLDSLNTVVHWLMLILFIGWGLFFLYTLIRFRASRNPKADYAGVKSHVSSYLEVAVALVEIVLLIGFSIPLWAARANPEDMPAEKEAVVVKVMGEQFAWNVHYAGADGIFGKQDIKLVTSDNAMGLDRNDPNSKDDIIKINDMHIPVGKPCIIHLTSKDVIHSFALQHMRVKHDVIPGSNFPIWFTPSKTSAAIREEMTRVVPTRNGIYGAPNVAMEEYKAGDGAVIVKKGQIVTEKEAVGALLKLKPSLVEKLTAAGIDHIKIAPETPTEITCAQLCGLGHYKMRGYYTVETQEEFDKWLKEQGATAGGGGTSYE